MNRLINKNPHFINNSAFFAGLLLLSFDNRIYLFNDKDIY